MDEAREKGEKGGKASGQARREKKTAREILEMLDALPVTGENKAKLAALGIPAEGHVQKALRLVALSEAKEEKR